jgi:hypothetical protein
LGVWCPVKEAPMDRFTFGLGQFWSVVAGDGAKNGFTSHDDTASAPHTLDARRQDGGDAEITIQDELGLLTAVRSRHG